MKFDAAIRAFHAFLISFITLFLSAGLLSLGGCSIFSSGPRATVKVQSVHYLNPDIYGRASPVVLTIYQLKSDYAFQQATYQALTQNSGKVLGGDLIDKNTVEVRPNDSQSVSQQISPNTQYLGIVAAYRNVNNAMWHKVIKIEQKDGKHPVLYLNLQSQGFTVRVDYSSNFLS